jgi:putative methyltransferase (TIGR04325 family)
MNISDFIPPLFITFYQKHKKGFQKYDTYEEALIDSDGYEESEIIEVVSKKTEILKNKLVKESVRTIDSNQITQNLFIIKLILKDQGINVLDLGGACGANYLHVKHFLQSSIKNWIVVETPAMTRQGKEQFQDENLKFLSIEKISEINTLIPVIGERDLIFASGVLQCVPDPYKMLDQILNLKFQNIYITRTSISRAIQEPIIFKFISHLSDNGPGSLPATIKDRTVTYPTRIIPYEPFLSYLSSIPGYNLEIVFEESEPRTMPFARGVTIPVSMFGCLLRKTTP